MLGRKLPGFCKDTAYRFMKMGCIHLIRFTTILSSQIVNKSIYDLTSDQRVDAFVIDDSMFERGRSQKDELLTKVWDYAKARYCYGFRIITFGWIDGASFLPVNSVLAGNAVGIRGVDLRDPGFKARSENVVTFTDSSVIFEDLWQE